MHSINVYSINFYFAQKLTLFTKYEYRVACCFTTFPRKVEPPVSARGTGEDFYQSNLPFSVHFPLQEKGGRVRQCPEQT